MSSGSVDPALAMLARRAGILTQWKDAAGRLQHVGEPVLRHLLESLGLPCMSPSQMSDSLHVLEQDDVTRHGDMVVVRAGQTPRLTCVATGRWKLLLESGHVMTGTLEAEPDGQVRFPPVSEPGYHSLILDNMTLTLAVAPSRCSGHDHGVAPEQRGWGLVAQIYSLDNTNRGGGRASGMPAWAQGANFSAVRALAAGAAREGASALALSPAHAMFSADPQRYSPYSPSSRLFLNVCYADPAQVLGMDMVQHVLGQWHPADTASVPAQGGLLDWPRIAALRLRLLRDTFSRFRDAGPVHLNERFQAFRHDAGSALQHHCVYEALHGFHVPALGAGHGWQDWPSALQDPDSPETRQFARQHDDEVTFHAFAQWLAHDGLRDAQDSAKSAGMSCGLISDLAIGTDPRGSHAWSLQQDILVGVAVGAPPDVYQAQGQNWGLTAFSPRGLRAGAYDAFIATLRASLQYSGGIRIDHIAGMERLWLIPDGAVAAEGAYLSYPRSDLLGLIALEAMRHDAIVIGENLGTVSDELNRALVDYGMSGTNVLWFEHDEPDLPTQVAPFRSARHWSGDAVAMPSTHDLPTIHGWWQERDIHWRLLLGQLTRVSQSGVQDERAGQRADLWRALQEEGCVSRASGMPPVETPLSAILSFVARAPGPLALFSLEDLLGVLDQPNMPGVVAGQGLVTHPNWVQQLPASVDAMFADSGVTERIATIRQSRSLP